MSTIRELLAIARSSWGLGIVSGAEPLGPEREPSAFPSAEELQAMLVRGEAYLLLGTEVLKDATRAEHVTLNRVLGMEVVESEHVDPHYIGIIPKIKPPMFEP